MPKTQLTIIVVIILFLHGCSILAPNADNTSAPHVPLSITELDQWQLSGKINLRDKRSSQTAYLNWSQCQQTFDIRITGPLGQGAIHLFGNQHTATLQTQEGENSADSAEQLLSAYVEWPLPISQLVFWIRGIPDPSHAYQTSTEDGNFKQINWDLKFKKWQTIDGYQLPKLATASNKEFKITLLLKNWHLNTDCSE